MDRRSFLVNHSVALGAAIAGLGVATGSSAAASPGVVVAIPIIRNPKSSNESFLATARRLADFLKNSPGFLDGVLLRVAFKDTPFDYIEVTRWETSKHWEDLFSDKKFLALIEASDAFTVRAANIFTPVAL